MIDILGFHKLSFLVSTQNNLLYNAFKYKTVVGNILMYYLTD